MNNSSAAEKSPEESPSSGSNHSSGDSGRISEKIQELEAQLKEKDQKYLYLYAEFENFKKRAIKERSDLLKYGWEGPVRDLLQVMDNLERALAHMPPNSDKTLIDGLKMVLNQFRATLEKQGVQSIESVQKEFDPNLHEAVGQEESDLPPGHVVKEHARGFTMHGRLLRPARVVVSGGKGNGKENTGS